MGTKKARGHKIRVIDYGVLPLTEPNYQLLAEFVVSGEPARKSNQRRLVINKKTLKPSFIKSQKAMDYQENFNKQVPADAKQGWGSPDEPLALWLHIYYASARPDLSSELIMDLLEKAGVIANDRYIKQQMLFGAIDTENPRVEIKLYRII